MTKIELKIILVFCLYVFFVPFLMGVSENMQKSDVSGGLVLTVPEIPSGGFATIEQLREFARRPIAPGDIYPLQCKGEDVWVLIRSIGSSGALEEVSVFALEAGVYEVVFMIPFGLTHYKAETSEDGVLVFLKYDQNAKKYIRFIEMHSIPQLTSSISYPQVVAPSGRMLGSPLDNGLYGSKQSKKVSARPFYQKGGTQNVPIKQAKSREIKSKKASGAGLNIRQTAPPK